MTDYLEERLDNSDHLLEQMKRTDQKIVSLPPTVGETEDAEAAESSLKPGKVLPGLEYNGVSTDTEIVDNPKTIVNQGNDLVHNLEVEPKFAEKPDLKNVNPLLNAVGELEFFRETGGDLEPKDYERSGIFQSAESEKGQSGSALAVKLRQLDRAVSTQAGRVASKGRQSGFPVSLVNPQTRRIYQPDPARMPETEWEGGLTGVQSGSGGGQQWAEQADRIFQRDSRRYDGGFYLY